MSETNNALTKTADDSHVRFKEQVFSWLSEPLRDYVSRALAQKMPRGRGELLYRNLPQHLKQTCVDGKQHIVFVCYYAYPSTIKKSLILRQTGNYYTTLIACCIREDLKVYSWFDEVYEVEHYSELFSLMQEASPSAVTACIQPALLGALALEACPSTKVVVDVTDSCFFMRENQNAVEPQLERAVLERADAYVHKMPSAATEEIHQGWGINTPNFLAHSFPMRELFQENSAPQAPPYRVVYAGGIMPYRAAVRDGHEHMMMDPIIEQTAASNVSLTFYANQNAKDMHWEDQSRYFELQQKCPHFAFKQGVPFYQLPLELSTYHFGLLYDQKKISSWRHEAYVYNMSTKIFSYFEAGLPLLVYSDLEYICEIVEKHGLGVVYSLDSLHEIPAILDGADLELLRSNVKRYRQSHALETLVPILNKLYESENYKEVCCR